MKFNEKMQFSDKQLTDKQCEDLYKQWREGFGSNAAPRLIVDSPVGKQICVWMRGLYNEPAPAPFNRQSFQEFYSPIDGKRIASTQDLRNHEREHRVKQVGNDLLTTKGKDHDRHSNRAS